MLDVMVAFSTIQGMNYLATGNVPPRLGNAHPNIVPYQNFKTSDGDIILAVGNDSQFKRFCAVAGAPELPEDPRFDTNSNRLANRAELIPILEELIQQKTTDFWVQAMEENSISCGPINNLAQVFDDPHVIARGMKLEMDYPASNGGKVTLINSPIKMSGTPTTNRMAPPMLGQHTDEVLGELLELDAAGVQALRDDGVV